MRNAARIATLSTLLCCTFCSAQAQQTYRLTVPGTNVISQAERTGAELVIVNQGRPTRYRRDVIFDTADGVWLGFSSAAARQAIRWPASDRGRMQIAALGAGPARFRPSRMEIARTAPRVALPKPGETSLVRMAPELAGAGLWLGSFAGTDLRIRRPAGRDDCIWSLLYVGGDVYRIQCLQRGVARDLVAARRGGELFVELAAPSSDRGHLWTVTSSRFTPGTYSIRNLGFTRPDSFLALDPSRGIRLLPPAALRGATDWHFSRHAVGRPVSRVVRREVRAGPPLPDGRVELHNKHKRELWVLIVPANDPRAAIRQKLSAGEHRVLALRRAPETVIAETLEVYSPIGYQREEFVTQLPSPSLYDVSVYEVIVQSIAIDSTVPGGKLEDVQYAPKSVGWFDLPPLGERTVIDVFARATAMKNPGAVRKLELKNWQKKAETPDPVEELLDRFKKRR